MSTLIRLPEVLKLTGFKRSTLYRAVSMLHFPRPVKLGARASAWSLAEVERWIEGCLAERDAKVSG